MSSEDLILIAIDERIAYHKNEIAYLEKIRADHLALRSRKRSRVPRVDGRRRKTEIQTSSPNKLHKRKGRKQNDK